MSDFLKAYLYSFLH